MATVRRLSTLLLLATPLTAGAGGDTDWAWTSTADGAPNPSPDLATTSGADLGISPGGSATLSLPFTFPFYGGSHTSLTITSSGLVLPVSASSPGTWTAGSCVGDGTTTGPLIAPLWANWDLSLSGAVYAHTWPTGAIIEWSDVSLDSGDSSGQTFGVVLHESGEIAMYWADADSGVAATSRGRLGSAGVMDSAGDGVSLHCDSGDIYNATATWLTPWGIRHFAETIDDTETTASVAGAAASDRFGWALASAGDLDSDGGAELIVGATHADDVATNGGAVWIFSGAELDGSLQTSDALAAVLGAHASDLTGYAVSGGHDVDGDGTADVLISVHLDDTTDSNAGMAALFSGATLAAGGSWSTSDATAQISGETRNDYAGQALAIVGDVDADGYADMVIGAPNEDTGGTNAGIAYLVLGSAAPADMALSAADAAWFGEADQDGAGSTIAAAGDVDGDGTDDFLVGAPDNGDGGVSAGATYLLRGSVITGGVSGIGSMQTINGDTAGIQTGYALAGGADIDQDGHDDLLIGAWLDGAGDGSAYVVRGRSTGYPSSVGTAWSALSGATGDRLAAALAPIDISGDGDIAVVTGAHGNNDGASAGGAVYLFHPDVTASGSGAAPGDVYGAILGTDSSGYLGTAIATADFDGDGHSDIAAGAYGADGDATASGQVYVQRGQPTWIDDDGDGHISSDAGGLDCDDSDASIGPGNADDCDGIDNDCDGEVDQGYTDTDGDGDADCVDSEECDGVDNDGDGLIDEGMPDTDGDGLCDTLDGEDCDGLDNDGDGEIDEGYPDTDGDHIADCLDTEECDGLDNNGDGGVDEGYPDTDGDGIKDCVDPETCDGLDNDGDGTVDEGYPDGDGDGLADCIDTEECDGVDNDGDGEVDEEQQDVDGDGICDELDREDCDGIDNDGDGRVDEDFEDNDGDGVADCVDGEDCDGVDNNGDGNTDEGYPDTDGDGTADCVETEECDGLDNDGDGRVDEGFADTDLDGLPDCVDTEECDGIDNDGDGRIDEDFPDADGDGAADCIDREACDGVDNDGDGEVDEGFVDADADGVADCIDVDIPETDASPDAGEDDLQASGCACSSRSGTPMERGSAAFFALIAVVFLRRRDQGSLASRARM